MSVRAMRANADRLLGSLRAVDALVAAERLSTDALVSAWQNPKTFAAGRDADEVLFEVTRRPGAPILGEALDGRLGSLVLAWAEAYASDRGRTLAPLFAKAEAALQPPSVLARSARARVRQGPPSDALASLPFCGASGWLHDPAERRTRAKVDLSVWWAGTDGRHVPSLARWLFDHEETFERVATRRADGPLRDRILAARAIAVAADGYEPSRAVDGILRVVRRLWSHPESLVWIPAARAIGRLAARHPDARGSLFRWLESPHLGEQRRATCALASMPGPESWWIESHVNGMLAKDRDPWMLAALGPALVHLIPEHRTTWESVGNHLLEATAPPEVWWSLTNGLIGARRVGVLDRLGGAVLEAARAHSNTATRSVTERQLWRDVRRATDFLDELDPDPTDVEGALNRLVGVALKSGPERTADRARTLAASIRATFDTALQSPGDGASIDDVAGRLHTAESSARAAAIGLWEPLLEAAGDDSVPTDRSALLTHLAQAAATTLDVESPDFPRHRSALRMLGSFLDGEPTGASIHFVLRAIDRPAWLRAPTKRQASRFKKFVGELIARIVTASRPRGGALDDDAYRRFLAWWCFAAASPDAVRFVARAESTAAEGLGVGARRHAEGLRASITKGNEPSTGAWRDRVQKELVALRADGTALHDAVLRLADGLGRVHGANQKKDATATQIAIIELGEATATFHSLLSEPGRALDVDAGMRSTDEGIGALVASTVAALSGEIDAVDLGDAWRTAGGPLLGPVLEAAIVACLRTQKRTSSSWGDRTIRQIGPYRLDSHLGGGAQGEVWRVVRQPVGRLFVMKLLPARSATMGQMELSLMREALAGEADLLKRMYHPNVSNFVDFGWEGEQPYLVLEWLVGCDLDVYQAARPLTFNELAPIVEDVVNGLTAMHDAGLVHCDLKPGNVFLRLPLPTRAPVFDPERHRDPSKTPILGSVVIDFGVSRTWSTSSDVDVISGTPGYLAPEQTQGEVHPNTDVYALAATICRSITGRSFFEDIGALGARLLAHGSQKPLDGGDLRARLGAVAPTAIVDLIDDATAIRPEDRPDIAAFGRRFLEAAN